MRRLLRDRAFQQGRGRLQGIRAESRDPLRRPGQRDGGRYAPRAPSGVRGRYPGARHLLRRAGHVRPARRQGGRARPSGIRPGDHRNRR